MERKKIRPAPADLLSSDPHLPEMIRYVEHLVEGREAEAIASNAALAYLALITAFSQKGLLQVDWAPRLLIEAGGREFEILLDNQEDVHGLSNALTLALASPVKVDVASQHVSPDSFRLSKSKAASLLDALEARDFKVATIPRTASGAPAIAPSIPSRDAEDEMMSTSEVKGIMDQLKVLRTLDERSVALSVTTDFAYWKLGVSYQAFAHRSRQELGSGLHPRTEQKVILDMLCNEAEFQVAPKDLATLWSLKKRLQRGRKFVLLVKIFSKDILYAVPEVSVTRLDGVKLGDLVKLENGGVEKNRVTRILARMKP